MTSGTSTGKLEDNGDQSVKTLPQVHKTTLSKEYDMPTVRHGIAVNLRLDVNNRLSVGLQPCNIDLNIEMPNAD